MLLSETTFSILKSPPSLKIAVWDTTEKIYFKLFVIQIPRVTQAFFFDRAKKTQGRKNSKLKEKTQNSSKKLKYSANFGVIYCKNQGKGPKNKGETTKMTKSRLKHY